jgi:C4-dicarboxylate-specific signal transduction histidine kinase
MNHKRHPEANLVFMGRVVASYSHEIKNVLAIINETTGLMHDLLTLKKEDLAQQSERFTKSLKDIGDHVQRGQQLSTFLNTLAHAPDKEVNGIDLINSMQTVFALCNRLVRNKSLHLTFHSDQAPLHITTKPVECMHSIFCALEWAMTNSQPGTEIVFSTQAEKQGVRIEVTGWTERNETDEGELFQHLKRLVTTLQGACTINGKVMIITLPKHIDV